MSPLARMCRDCTTIITTGIRCPRHEHDHNQRRNNRPIAHIYADPRWRLCRQVVLDRAGHMCQMDGCEQRANTAHHHPISVLNCPDPYNPDTCQALCHACHGKVDGRGKHGGVGSGSRTAEPPKPFANLPFTETRRGSGPSVLVA